jgi:hypothetical protein
MRFQTICIILIALIITSCTQNVGKWRAGSSYNLIGKIYTLSCFVSGPNDEWTYNEKLEMLNLLNESQKWISKEALKYSISVDFNESGNFGLNNDIKLPFIERGNGSGNESVDWVSKVFYKIGYKSNLDFDSWIKKNTNANNYNVIIFVKGKGRSYAMPYSSEMEKEKKYVEGAVLYEKYSGNEKMCSSSIAHEILHLYGAWDLYKTYAQSESNELKAKRLFPNSIMLRTSYNINELDIDSLSAWLVGWNKYPKEWYETFRPKDY